MVGTVGGCGWDGDVGEGADEGDSRGSVLAGHVMSRVSNLVTN